MEVPLTASQEVNNVPALEDIATVHRGAIDDAVFCVAVPKESDSSCLLIYCHGFRPEGTPLFANIDDPFWLRLVQQGWTVAATSYRRSGLVVADAIRDVFNLRNWVCIEVGVPVWCFLDGRSMGGAISTRIAERPNIRRLFNGVLAIGAALLVKEEGCELTYKPTIPILYLTNTSEHGPIENYIARVKENAEAERKAGVGGEDEITTPALHAVHREGHNWVNARERWRAFSCLVEWAFVGSLVTEFRFDGTRPANVRAPVAPERRELPDGSQALEATVVLVEDLSTFHLNVRLADLDAIRVRINSVCRLEHKGVSTPVHIGAYPFVGIPDTAIVLSETPEDFLCLFSLSEFRNKPAESVLALGLTLGDKFLIVAPKEAPRPVKRKPMPPPIDL
jgi:hypothetical protein